MSSQLSSSMVTQGNSLESRIGSLGTSDWPAMKRSNARRMGLPKFLTYLRRAALRVSSAATATIAYNFPAPCDAQGCFTTFGVLHPTIAFIEIRRVTIEHVPRCVPDMTKVGLDTARLVEWSTPDFTLAGMTPRSLFRRHERYLFPFFGFRLRRDKSRP